MLVSIDKFGGIVPKIYDPRLLPKGKGQVAKNCRFDHGGVMPLGSDDFTYTPTNAGPLESLYLYRDEYWFAWGSDVDAVLNPEENDTFKRVYFTEGGILKVTDKDIFDQGGTDYPMVSRLPSPPAPTSPVVTMPGIFSGFSAVIKLEVTAAGVLVTAGNSGFANLSPDTRLQFFDTGVAAIDGKTFGFTLKKYYFGREHLTVSFYLNDVFSLGGPATVTPLYPEITITAAGGQAISKENPAAVTHAGHGLVSGDILGFSSMDGMGELDGWSGSITVVDANHFTLDGVDSTGYETFISGKYQKFAAFKVNNDPVKLQSRAYVRTLVNGYGSEGPPSMASEIVSVLDGDSMTLDWTPDVLDPDNDIVSTKLYRLNMDANGNEQYQEVVQLPVGTYTYTDSKAGAELGEILASAEWDGAPTGVTGLVTLPNAGAACYFGNTLCFAVPGFLHAWPVRYRKATERPIMGLVGWGTTVVALTTGLPEAMTFTDPGNAVPERLPSGYACVSKRSIVNMGQYWAYSSPEGLVAIGPGISKVMTGDLFSREDWAKYAPESILGFMWEGMYVGFYDTGEVQAGFLFDPRTEDFKDLDLYATGGYRDHKTGILYLQAGDDIVSFATNNDDPRQMELVSRRETFRPSVFNAIQVLANSYPVTVDITYPGMVDENGAPAPQTVTAEVLSGDPERIEPPNTLVDRVDVKVYGANGASVVYLASTIEELPI